MKDFEDYESDEAERISEGRLFWKPFNENGVATTLKKEDFLSKLFYCKKCRRQMEDPVVTACCNKHVCRGCAIKEIGFDRECSICFMFVSVCKLREPHPVSNFFLKIMNARIVRCTDSECKMEMKYADFAEHLEKSCRRFVRCCFCRMSHRVVDDHVCEGNFRARKQELEKELEGQNKEYKKLMTRQRTIFYDMGGYPGDIMPENIDDFNMFFGNLRMQDDFMF